MITYNDIYEYLRKERYFEPLQPLPQNFLAEVSNYFTEKKGMADKSEDTFSDAIIKMKKQFENAIGLFRELMLRRRKKLLNLAFVAAETGISKRDFENMLEFEKEFFDKTVKGLEQSEKEIADFMNGKKAGKFRNKMIVFRQDTEEFLGITGEKLGPFTKGEIANLPMEITNILVAGGQAEFIEEE